MYLLRNTTQDWTSLVAQMVKNQPANAGDARDAGLYYVDWFVDIEESLHPWNKAHLVMMYDLFIYLFSFIFISWRLITL